MSITEHWPVGPAGSLQPLPSGAVRWSRMWLDERGRPQTSDHDVPVDADGRRTGHVRHTCPGHVEVQQQDHFGRTVWDRQPCEQVEWLAPSRKPRFCPDHGGRLQPDPGGRSPWLPWGEMWRDLEAPVVRPAAVGAAVGMLGAAVDVAHVPAWEVGLLAAPVAAGVWWSARWWLTRQATQVGRLDPADEVTGRRVRRTVARRARAAGWTAAAGGTWIAAAGSLGVDPSTAGGAVMWVSLAALTAACSHPWRRHVRAERARPVPTVVLPTEAEEAMPGEVEAKAVWRRRAAAANGPLPGTTLTDFRLIKGGWAATVISDQPGSIDPDRFGLAARRVAAALRVSIAHVTIEVNPSDVSTATLSMQPRSPLCEERLWPGPADTCDWAAGVQRIGWFADDTPAYYRWWNTSGPWHDLISGCTGGGKSELVLLLLLAELHSGGLVLSRVIDPQAGQSFGQIQDHVDWFAPNLAEAQLLLLDAVKEMRRRNRVFSRARVRTWQPSTEYPLISITIDEAHEVLQDPICLALVEKIAKMARKTGVKLRLVTQVPVVTEIGNSTPVKDAVLAGQIVVFRTGTPVSTQAALGGALDVDPHRLPPEWPAGSPAAGRPTAGVGWLLGMSRRPMALRTFHTGGERGLPRWLYGPDGKLTITPGRPSQAAIDASGPLWGRRHERAAAALDAPVDDGDILPGGLVAKLMGAAAGKIVEPVSGGDGGQTARDLVLRVAVAHADQVGRVDKQTLAQHVRGLDGQPMPERTLGKAVSDLIGALCLVRIKNGRYEVTDKGRAQSRDEVEQTVARMIGDKDGDS